MRRGLGRFAASVASASLVIASVFADAGPAVGQNPPTVTSVSPTAGPSAGGTTVTITGTNFVTSSAGSTTVGFGATQATNVSCTSSTTCTATAPAGTGTVDVTVTNTNGTSAASRSDQFSYGSPAVTGISPSSGERSGGTVVTLTGTGFTTDATVTFGGTPAASESCAAATSCTALSPPGAATVDVTVTNPAGTSAPSPADQFSYSSTDLTSALAVPVPDAGGTAPTEIDAISCPARTWCGAIAPPSIAQQYASLMTGDGGDWTAVAAPYPQGAMTNGGAQVVNQVACPAVGTCYTGGSYTSTNNVQQPVLDTFNAGSWTAENVPTPSGSTGGQLRNLTCASVSVCYADGYFLDSSGGQQGLITTISSGTLTSVEPPVPPGASTSPDQYRSVGDLSCPAAGWCMATLSYMDNSSTIRVALLLLSNGTWTVLTPQTAPNPSYSIGLTCPAIGWCLLDGTYVDNLAQPHYFLETYSNGTWSSTDGPVDPNAPSGDVVNALGATACASAGWCVAYANYGTSYFGPPMAAEVLTLANGTWTASALPPPPAPANPNYFGLGPISCPQAGSCTAAGGYEDYPTGSVTAGVFTLANGGWTFTRVDGIQSFRAVSCPTISWCGFAGSSDSSTPAVDYIQHGGGATGIAVSSSADPAFFGSNHQVSVTYTATVTPSPDAGTVSFYDSSATVPGCANQPVDPSTGDAQCIVTYIANGTHAITTSYYGDTAFAESGPSVPLTQTIDGVQTQLTISSSSNPAVLGPSSQPVSVTYTAQVAPTPDGGTVAFYDSSAVVPACGARPVDLTTGRAQCSVQYDSAGVHSITASYSGNSDFAPSGPSAALGQDIIPPCPTGVTHLAAGEPWAVAAMTATINGRACPGYWVVTRTGGVTAIGAAPWLGDMSGRGLNAPMVDIAATPTGNGYYLLGGDGGIFTYGDAVFRGSTGGKHLNAPVVAMAVTPAGDGYWLAASDGGIFTFGNAPFYGSKGGQPLNKPVVGMSADNLTGGYWLVASDGGVFTFNTPFYGSMGGKQLNQPVVGMSPQPDGHGYRMVASDGGVFDFGNATFYGSLPGQGVPNPQVTTMASSIDGNGYYLINGAGNIWAFGDAPYLGNA